MKPNPLQKINLLAHIPEQLPQELFEQLFENAHVKIERIVSRGHRSPSDFWYDQDWDEWVLVLKGNAGLRLADRPDVMLGPGEALLIPAGVKHQVAWTDEQSETVWLAIHIL
jgi:cupin 2 domain-containing protein